MKSIRSENLALLETAENAVPPVPPIAAAPASEASEPLVRSGIWSIFDQGIVSGTNFVTLWILARKCSQEDVGLYSLAWTLVVFLTAAQANLISLPYTMYSHRRKGNELATYAGSALAHQLLTSLVAVLCFLILDVTLAFGVGPERLRPAAWVLLGAIPLILLRDYARRFCFAHLTLGTAIVVDALVATLQLSALLVLAWTKQLSPATGYVAMGAACGIACVAWWILNPQTIRFSWHGLFHDWQLNWAFGKWALTSQLTGLAFYALPWLLASVHGEAQTGELAACTTLVGLANLFVIGLNNFLTPKAAQAFANRGPSALASVLRTAFLSAAAVLGPLCVIVYFAGDTVAGRLFGAAYADTGRLMTILAVAALIDSIGMTASTGIWAVDRPAANFWSDALQMATTLAIAVWLVFPLAAVGIGVAIVIGRIVGASVRWAVLLQSIASLRCKAAMAANIEHIVPAPYTASLAERAQVGP